jgi:hypothetical protein
MCDVFAMCMRRKRVVVSKMRFNRLLVAVSKNYVVCQCFFVCLVSRVVLIVKMVSALGKHDVYVTLLRRIGAGNQTLIVHIHCDYFSKA